ncbi:MAG: hypothetical protein KGL39_27940 [Patescibacteria group bacterium]|nr:hypothetical protein [Patescibacteria group bacterium]
MNMNEWLKAFGNNLALATRYRTMADKEQDAEWRKMTRGMMRVAARNAMYYRRLILKEAA